MLRRDRLPRMTIRQKLQFPDIVLELIGGDLLVALVCFGLFHGGGRSDIADVHFTIAIRSL
jgi:hypothetical protein